jgi:hypothetical protein
MRFLTEAAPLDKVELRRALSELKIPIATSRRESIVRRLAAQGQRQANARAGY